MKKLTVLLLALVGFSAVADVAHRLPKDGEQAYFTEYDVSGRGHQVLRTAKDGRFYPKSDVTIRVLENGQEAIFSELNVSGRYEDVPYVVRNHKWTRKFPKAVAEVTNKLPANGKIIVSTYTWTDVSGRQHDRPAEYIYQGGSWVLLRLLELDEEGGSSIPPRFLAFGMQVALQFVLSSQSRKANDVSENSSCVSNLLVYHAFAGEWTRW